MPHARWHRTLVIEELPPANLDFVQAHGIRLVQIGVEGNKVRGREGWYLRAQEPRQPILDFELHGDLPSVNQSSQTLMGSEGQNNFRFPCPYSTREAALAAFLPLGEVVATGCRHSILP